jgi:lysophospholipase L1-like esterase
MNYSRRSFLNHVALATGGFISVPAIISAAIPGDMPKKQLLFPPNGVILFQGDSITDAGREKEKELPNSAGSFGSGYAYLAGAGLLDVFSHMNISVYNRGISGNKVYQLAERWQKDCLDLKPDLLSILIGINDYWHMRNGKYDGTVETYETDYRKLLTRTRDALPNINLVICQPFALPGTTAVDETWVDPVRAYQDVAFKLSKEFKTIWVPFQKVFDEAIRHAPAKYWAADGVHPSMAGAHLMAAAWGKMVLGLEI